jgi:phosphate:Na+ symporter
MASLLLVSLGGAVALLLWGLHMVHTGIIRTFGSDLRRFLGYALRNRLSAFGTGLGLTAALQSSTATALMTTSLAADGLIGLVPALAIMLGANVGTTLIVQVLSFNIYVISPFLLVGGVVAFKFVGAGRWHQIGRVLIGFGLMVLALHLLLEALAPAENAPAMREFIGMVTAEPAMCVLAAALLTWVAHSSVATVLLTISLAHTQIVGPEAALALVLGANLGSAINPLFEAGRSGNLASKRVPIGNLMNRLVGIALAYPLLGPITEWGLRLQPNVALLTSEFHLGFNLVLALIFLVPLPAIGALLERHLPEQPDAEDPGVPRYLSDAVVAMPSIALSEAVRETLRIVDFVETMLRQVMTALLTNDKESIARVSQADDIVDRLEKSVRLYITRLTRENLEGNEARRAAEIMSFAINLEHIGDIIDKNLLQIAIKKIKQNANFSHEGAVEIEALYQRVRKSLRLSVGVFVSGDAEAARWLLQEKSEVRRSERTATANHLSRLREGRLETLDTMAMHVDTLRDLKRIHSHICSVAYSFQERDEEAAAAGQAAARATA